jgi:hypothetical protein
MKRLLLLGIIALSFTSNAQWIVNKLDNGFDTPSKIAYTNEKQATYLKLEYVNEGVVFYVGGETYCGDGPVFVELSFQVTGVNKQYGRACPLYGDEDPIAVVSVDLINEDFYADFKSASTIKIRISDFDCSETVKTMYTFSMSGSTAAVNYVSKP